MLAWADMSLAPGNGPVQITQEQLQARIQELGRKIRADYQGKDPHLICVLNGAFLFHADLVRAIGLPCTIDFLQASSYGDAKQTSGEVGPVVATTPSKAGMHSKTALRLVSMLASVDRSA